MTDFWKNLTRSWQDTISLILGVWLVLSPWALGFTGTPVAMWNAVLFGVLIAIMALMALVEFHDWEEWADMAIGAWLVVSPWVLGYAMAQMPAVPDGGSYAATWNGIAVGVLTFGMAAWSLFDHRHQTHA
jgi:hypothetical protein